MGCFTHTGTLAIAVCKTCGKAICRACVIETPMAVACSEACAREAIELHELNQRGKKLYGIGIGATKKLPSIPILFGLFTIFVFGMGVFNTIRDRGIDYGSFGFGAFLAVFCIITYRRNKDFGIQM